MKKKKTERAKIKDKLDYEFSLYIRRRDNFTCVTCGKKGIVGDGEMQCGHLFSRVALSTRWDEDNAFCQDRGCNFRHEMDWMPLELYYKEKKGDEAFDRLYRKYNTPKKYNIAELKELLEYYREKNKENKDV